MSDEDLETMKSSELLRLMVKHAEAYDVFVNNNPRVFSWDMGIWLDVELGPIDMIGCSACVAGAILYGLGGRNLPGDMTWMRRVDALRQGKLIMGVLGYEPHLRDKLYELMDWFWDNRPVLSASGNLSWNSQEDPPFYLEFADKLEEAGF